jgi:hypothetical protein
MSDSKRSSFLRRSSAVKSPLPLAKHDAKSPGPPITNPGSRSASIETSNQRVQASPVSSNKSYIKENNDDEAETWKKQALGKEQALEEALLDKEMAQASVDLLEVENQTLAIKVQELEAKLEWTRQNLVQGIRNTAYIE